jgi:hypothetical protein
MRFPSVCLAGIFTLALAVASAQQPAAPAEPAAPTAAPVADQDWTPTEVMNLTVLPKDMPPDTVMKIMRDWNAALNVDCVFCHVGQVGKPLSTYDFASDDKKRKEVSRVMLRAAMAMNETFKPLDDDPPQVQCSTCHKRSRHVEADLPPAKPKDEPK